MFFSIIIPVFNRPFEIKELLQSLTTQSYQNFEVIIVEDGSSITCQHVVEAFEGVLNIHYFFIKNLGQGFARNYGMHKANGDFYVLFDSDCIIPEEYFKVLTEALNKRKLDAFGGPDAARKDFSLFQKAMNYSMTSFLTTGGIRGKMKNPDAFQARGFNMGLSKEAFLVSGGFVDPNRAEDIELSIRLKKMGFKLQLVEEAFVYHKRKNTIKSFFKQSYSFGKNRINVSRFHPEAIKLIHLLPLFFLIGWVGLIFCIWLLPLIAYLGWSLFGVWCSAIFIDSILQTGSFRVGLLSILTSFGQLSCYGAGLLVAWIYKKIG